MRLSGPRKQAVAAVAEHFHASWEAAEGAAADAWLTIDGRRIAVAAVSIRQGPEGTPPRLRFDKVVMRLVGGVREAMGEAVPDGDTVAFTVTAPIRQAAKTARAIEDEIGGCLKRPAKSVERTLTIHGNGIALRLLRGGVKGAARVIGFVHNPDVDGACCSTLCRRCRRVSARHRRAHPRARRESAGW